jgi:anaerobic ribonucleoside-triphosphate reductase
MENTKQKNLLEKHTEKRTKCLVFTRVMGYHRPVESFNIGKKGEHKERIPFVEHVDEPGRL